MKVVLLLLIFAGSAFAQTNVVGPVTNYVIVVNQSEIPVSVPLTGLDWSTQVTYFLNGASYGWPVALGLGIFWAVRRAASFRPPSSND